VGGSVFTKFYVLNFTIVNLIKHVINHKKHSADVFAKLLVNEFYMCDYPKNCSNF